jgi:Polysaccharide deacetylase
MKKIFYIFLLFTSLIYSQGINSGLFFSQQGVSSSKLRKIKITFDAQPTKVNVKKAFYKYDKEFAFSYGLDDNFVGQYRVAVPLFNGGTIILKQGITSNYPGLFYTDGAGNNIPFSATLNLNMNGINTDKNPLTYMNEFMLKDSYVKNFSIANHSWSHQNQFTAPGFNTDPTIRNQEILSQITQNYNKIKEVLGIKSQNFASPSNDPLYDPITLDMVNSGYLKLVNNINNPKSEFGHSPNRYAEYWITNSALGFSRDFDTWKQSTIKRTPNDFNFINTLLNAAKTAGNQHVWITMATHRIDQSETENPNGGSMRFESFKWIMEGLASRYGAAGLDNMWMAPIEVVYEYLKCVEKSKIVQSQNGNTVTLTLDFNDVDETFREHSLSLLIDTDTNITNIEYEGFDAHSDSINYKNLGANTALINVGYKQEHERLAYSKLQASVAVETLENTKSKADLDIAQPLVSVLTNGTFKDLLQARIDKVIVIENSIVIQIDFGRNVNGHELAYPWNSFSFPGVGVAVGSKLLNLNTTTSTKSGINIEVITAFDNYDGNFSGVKGDPKANFPYEAERDCFKTPNGLTSTLRLSNLDKTKLYDFTAFCSRDFIGAGTEITINNIKASVDHKKNYYKLITINDIVPNADGTIDISIKGLGTSNVFGFLNVLQITQKPSK